MENGDEEKLIRRGDRNRKYLMHFKAWIRDDRVPSFRLPDSLRVCFPQRGIARDEGSRLLRHDWTMMALCVRPDEAEFI